MKLQISRKKWRTAKGLFWGGILWMIASAFLVSLSGRQFLALLFVGLGIGLAGALWANSLCRCPQCGKELIGRGWGSLALTPYPHCPNCGWKVEIEWMDRKET